MGLYIRNSFPQKVGREMIVEEGCVESGGIKVCVERKRRKREESYWRWAEKRDRKILKALKKKHQLYEQMLKERSVLRDMLKVLKQQIEIVSQMVNQGKIDSMVLWQLLQKKATQEAKVRALQKQYNSMIRKWIKSYIVASEIFKAYKPLHSIPVTPTRSVISNVLKVMETDIEHMRIYRIVNKREIEAFTGLLEVLNNLLLDKLDNDQVEIKTHYMLRKYVQTLIHQYIELKPVDPIQSAVYATLKHI